ncbi:MAG: hypothetical protein P0116_08455 [Candidatus Nitrosocosmicus sp.]|nr:hypothetical protein [Candidatus Nitrosocosmicus sp.]
MPQSDGLLHHHLPSSQHHHFAVTATVTAIIAITASLLYTFLTTLVRINSGSSCSGGRSLCVNSLVG